MATRQQHYTWARRITAAALNGERANAEGFTGWSRADLIALAQLHATLALAAPPPPRIIRTTDELASPAPAGPDAPGGHP